MIIAAAISIGGLQIAFRYNKRVLMLEKCILMVNAINAEIEYLLKPSADIIDSLVDRQDLADLKFLRSCLLKMNEGEDFYSAWRASLNDKENVAYLSDSDVEILNSFSELFGVTGCDGQSLNCNLFSSKLQFVLNEAVKDRDKYSKLFSSLGLLTGLCFIIVFI